MSTALAPVEKGVAATVKADSAMQALLSGWMIYARQKPEKITVDGANVDTPYDYITLGSRSEASSNTFDRSGNLGSYFIHIWSRKNQLAAIYKELERLLNGKRLTIEGHTMVNGVTRYVTDFVDPDGKTQHAVVQYEVLSQAGT